ncbi:uncharacterized protein LOC112532558 isoform X1 [Gallus gallus]|uniref:uncharacterized protein LOC112532558 isoform X1 n=1 Tax=Gallus gallus TaxID=9031 RepID=UPI001AE91D07|nr:uncharacterized protein LOC112532558 isoform X1 [Gallus gallus]
MVMWRSKPALEPRDMAAVGTARPRGCQRAGPHRYRNGPPPERFRVTGGAQALEDSQLAHRHAPSPPLRMPELRGTHRPRASPLESVRSRAWSRYGLRGGGRDGGCRVVTCRLRRTIREPPRRCLAERAPVNRLHPLHTVAKGRSAQQYVVQFHLNLLSATII